MIWLKDADKAMGGKAFGLGELIKAGFNVPNGFVLSDADIKQVLDGEINELSLLLNDFPKSTLFAVRSSAAAEDGNDNSYAGMFESQLNVPNDLELITAAIEYVNNSSKAFRVAEYSDGKEQFMNIVIQEMVIPRIAGVAFSRAIDITGEDVILLEFVSGLADKLVAGKAKATQVTAPLHASEGADGNVAIYGHPTDCNGIDELIHQVRRVAAHFNNDMDIEWCIDHNNSVYLVQARPITRIPVINESNATGIVASHGFAKGQSFVIDEDMDDDEIIKLISQFPRNAILVAATTDTQYLPAMKRAAGIITEEGSALSHAAIVSRELGIPCIAGFSNALSLFPTGGQLTLDANNGCITYNDITYQLTHKKSFSFADVYSFDDIVEMNIDGKVVLFQPTFDGIAMYMPWDVSPQEAEQYEIFARKAFGSSTVRCTNEKYAWYFEYQRFQKLPYFSSVCSKVKKLCDALDRAGISKLYEQAVSVLDRIVKGKEDLNDYDKVVVEEICVAYHFILDMILPNGYAVQAAYFKSLPLLSGSNISFSDFLNGENVGENDKADEIHRIYEFITLVGKCRNEICDQLVTMGAMSYDYFETRESRIAKGLKCAEIGSDSDGSDIESYFYSSLNLSKSVFSLAECLKSLV